MTLIAFSFKFLVSGKLPINMTKKLQTHDWIMVSFYSTECIYNLRNPKRYVFDIMDKISNERQKEQKICLEGTKNDGS